MVTGEAEKEIHRGLLTKESSDQKEDGKTEDDQNEETVNKVKFFFVMKATDNIFFLIVKSLDFFYLKIKWMKKKFKNSLKGFSFIPFFLFIPLSRMLTSAETLA